MHNKAKKYQKEQIKTDKRLVAVFTAFCISIGALCLRLYILCVKGTEYVASESHYYSVDIQKIRGEIFDCNGKKLVDSEYDNIAVMKPTMKALMSIEKVSDAKTAEELKKRMKNGTAVTLNIGSAQIDENEDTLLCKRYIRYSNNQSARHIIGYTDSDGRGVSGIEKSFDDLLSTGKSSKIRFSADAYGRIISGGRTERLNFDIPTGSVYLTIDKEIQYFSEQALNLYGVNEGGAIVADVKTGAIRAIASRPDFDSERLEDYLSDESAPLVNRALNAYAVGSVFKAAVAVAAIEHGIDDFYYKCSGTCTVDGTVFGCNNRKVHGELNMQKALECSCNTYFIKLAQKIGGEMLLETVEKLGFGQEIKLADALSAKSGQLPSRYSLNNSGALANFSFGQGEFTATMLQMVQLFSAIANKGKYVTPYLVEKTRTAAGEENTHKEQYPVYAMSEYSSARLTNMLTSVVENGNAKKAKLENGISAAGKTATAQTGAYGKKGVEICNTWFCGFFPADNPKYVIVILKQGGSSGAEDCAPIFKMIADRISESDS